MIEAAYASARAAIRTAFAPLRPPPRQNVAEYALEHRLLDNKGGGTVGKWAHEKAPYLVAPMEALTSLDYLTVAVPGPGQSGKTSIGENWLLHSVGADPAKLLWYMQTDSSLEAYVKDRIERMIDQHEVLRDNLGHRPIDNSLHFKRFRAMSVEFLSATSSNLINKSAPRILADEIDAYPEGLGDVKALLDVRRQTFGRQSMLLAVSHPDRARGLVPERDWTAGIMAIYADSDRRVWYWPCPQCGAWSSPVPIAARYMAIDYPPDGTLDEIEAEARLVCPVNGCVIEDEHREAMNLAAFRSPFGGWVGEGQEIAQDGTVTGELVRRKTAGFWIVGAMSPFVMGGIGGLARARAKAEREREVTGEDETLRQVMVKQWGIPYTPPRSVGSIDANVLADRVEPGLDLGSVAEGVRFLTVAADIQIAHFEWLVRGWGVKGESWIVDRGRLLGEPATSPDDWDKLFVEVLQRPYPLGDGSGRMMRPRAAGFDMQGAPGVTLQAYAAWLRWRKARRLRLYGQVGGREAWSVVPLRGANRLGAPRLTVSYPDTQRKSNLVGSAGEVPVAQFNGGAFKDDLMGQLQRAEPGDWHVHLPKELRSKEPPHTWFEQLCAERRLPNGRWEKVQPGARNEALDLMVMNHVVAHLHGITRINWEKPPVWAAPWEENDATIFMPESAPPPGGTPAQPATPVTRVGPGQSRAPRSLARRLA